MNKEQILGIIRHILTAVGVIIVAKGYMDEATVITVVGAIITAVSGIWSIFDKSEVQMAKKVETFKEKQESKKFTTNI